MSNYTEKSTLLERFTQPVPAFVGELQLQVVELLRQNYFILMMSTGTRETIRRVMKHAVEVYWPIVDQFPRFVRGTGSALWNTSTVGGAPQSEREKLSRSIRSIWQVISDEEKEHRHHWETAAEELGAVLESETQNPFVRGLRESLSSINARIRITASAGVEINAAVWGHLLHGSDKFASALPEQARVWWLVDHPLYLENINGSHLGLLVKMLNTAQLLEENAFRADVIKQTQQFAQAIKWNFKY